MRAGGAHKDAIGVCASEMGDPQLALVVARLLDGTGSASATVAGCGPLLSQVVASDMQPGALHILCMCDITIDGGKLRIQILTESSSHLVLSFPLNGVDEKACVCYHAAQFTVLSECLKSPSEATVALLDEGSTTVS